MLRVEGHKVYLLGQRIHHGMLGTLCMLGGAVLCLHDRADAREWFRLT